MGLKEQLQRDKEKMSALAKPELVYREDEEQSDDSGSIFWGKERSSNRRAVMLDLRLKNGAYISLPYSYMTKVKFNPSIGLELYISGNYVKITGRNLHEMYNYLCRHRVTFIMANPNDKDTTEEQQTYVKDIEVTESDS